MKDSDIALIKSFRDDCYTGLYILGTASKGRFREEFRLYYEGGEVRTVVVGLTDWYSHYREMFGEQTALTCSHLHTPEGDCFTKEPQNYPRIALQKITLPSVQNLIAIALPYNPSFHIFALTLGKIPASSKRVSTSLKVRTEDECIA